MSRKSLLLIAAAVISTPAFVTSNALAKGSAAAHGVTYTPHVSTLKPAAKVAVPRATFSSTAGKVASTHRSGIVNDINKAVKDAAGNASPNGTPIGKAVGDAVKGATGSTSNPTPFGKAVDAARAAAGNAAKGNTGTVG